MVAPAREAGDRQLGCSVDDFVGAGAALSR